jgi:ribonuclease BN (tRNA processing enzyme)
MENSGKGITRRGLLATLATAPALTAAAPAVAQAEDIDAKAVQVQAALKAAKGTPLVLLGTGAGPVAGQAHGMTSHVMLHNGAAYVLDCGLGVTTQFARTGIPSSALRAIFITHHHPDHNIEYGPFLVIGWLHGMSQSIRAYGPPPLAQMTEDYLRSAKVTIDFWAEDFHMKPLGMIEVHDLPTAGAVMQDENVKVTSILVEHPPVKPAYGYRFDFRDRSIAFSGDTVALEAVAGMAKGADVLVHEAMNVPAIEAYIRQQLVKGTPGTLETFMKHMRGSCPGRGGRADCAGSGRQDARAVASRTGQQRQRRIVAGPGGEVFQRQDRRRPRPDGDLRRGCAAGRAKPQGPPHPAGFPGNSTPPSNREG